MSNQEIWKDVPEYEGFYKVSNFGRIKSVERTVERGYLNSKRKLVEKIKKSSLDKFGYPFLRLSKNGKKKNLFVHRIVALAFLKNNNNYPQVNHIDGNKTNCFVENLEWVNQSANSKHAFKIGLRKPSGSAVKYKPVAQFSIEGKLIREYKSITEAMKATGAGSISGCINNKKKYKTSGGYIWKTI